MSETARPILTTAWIMNDGTIRKASSESQQLFEDPFNYADSGENGLQRPPYDLDQLSGMLETNSLHYRACKQKAADVVGRGFTLRPREEPTPGEGGAPVVDPSVDAGETAWNAFVEAVESDERGDESFKERIQFAHEDFESVGWAALEFSRDGQGNLDGMWHVPAHTLRAHKDNRRYAQRRGGKTVWFKRFGLEGTVDRDRGGWSERTTTGDSAGNELVVIRNYTPRSSFYGLPDHIPALAAIAGWRAQAEFNVRFFDNQAVPAYAVIVEGADISPDFETKILEHFRSLKGDPHATLVIPVPGMPGDDATQVKVRFEKLAVDIKDASFRLYKQDNALEICIAHGIPPYRVSWPIMGSLGGATAEEMTKIYLDSIVQPRQETWDGRLTRALLGPKGLQIPTHVLKANELDTRNEMLDVEKGQLLIDMGVATPAWVASFLDLPEGASTEYKTAEPPAGGFGGLTAIDGGLLAKRWSTEVREFAAFRKSLEQLLDPGGSGMTLTLDRAIQVAAAGERYARQRLAKAALPASILVRDATIALLVPGFAADLVEYFDGVLERAGVSKDVSFPLDPDKVDWTLEAKLLGELLETIYIDMGTLAYGAVGEQLAIELSFTLEGATTATIRDRIATQVTQITGTLQETLRDKVEAAIARGMSIDELVAGSGDVMGLRDLFGSRAKLIALTETATAYNAAAIAGYAQSGIVDTVTVFDGPDCGWHSHDDPDLAHGSTRTLREANAQPISHPNCQRAFGAVVAR